MVNAKRSFFSSEKLTSILPNVFVENINGFRNKHIDGFGGVLFGEVTVKFFSKSSRDEAFN